MLVHNTIKIKHKKNPENSQVEKSMEGILDEKKDEIGPCIKCLILLPPQ